ncbi:MAG: malate synthase A [Thaumarchaeota archaeon]|nr:MAG: malate synthase A [Nitrososphaerota archaeon]
MTFSNLPSLEQSSDILTRDVIEFLALLVRRFSRRRDELLHRRALRQREIDSGVFPNFLPETSWVREGGWRIWPTPSDLQDRRVEITGPSGDAKMMINALNSGANTYMADFEDSQSPNWRQTIQGQVNLRDAIEGAIEYVSPEGKTYSLNEKVATLIVRPRGWHLLEKHVLLDGEPVSAALFDFAIFVFNNFERLLRKGTAPYFYLPKMESHLEARLWNDVFSLTEEELGIPRGTLKATVLIETLPAAFEMDEILYELREHSSGLNCGRWDYIFSFIKKLSHHPRFILPDRGAVTMDRAFLAAYVNLLIRTCHRRGAHAIGGMSAYIPIKNDEEANSLAFEKVRADKEREVLLGHDGTWVAHPGLVQLAREVFDGHMKGPNQVGKVNGDLEITSSDLLRVPEGAITETGIRTNISVGVQYIDAWLGGKGAVPIRNLMEDTATAEICRAQLWQWTRHGAVMSDGRRVTAELVRSLMSQELHVLAAGGGASKRDVAARLFEGLILSDEFEEFLTGVAYEELLRLEKLGEART